jgi:flagellar biosynthesis protein FlhF
MKLHRFTASTNHKAMQKIHDTLGPDALIYSTRSVDHGVEIVAGLPHSTEEIIDPAVVMTELHQSSSSSFNHATFAQTMSDRDLIEKLVSQVKVLDDNIKALAKNMTQAVHDPHRHESPDQAVKKNMVAMHLHKLGFTNPAFCQQFISQYLRTRKSLEKINELSIGNALLKHIDIHAMEFIDDKMICALIGPTGSGKTTTIAKLAKRYMSRYGGDSIGFIATDHDDVITKHQLLYYSNLFGIELEYANNKNELALALEAMKHKNLVLIDTYGVSQRNETELKRLLELLESQGKQISTYLTIPCNIQEAILEEVVNAFRTQNLSGCILTKQDESITLAPALSVAIQHKLSIAYVCYGQDINKHIDLVNPSSILQGLLPMAEKKVAPSQLITAIKEIRPIKKIKEDAYALQT